MAQNHQDEIKGGRGSDYYASYPLPLLCKGQFLHSSTKKIMTKYSKFSYVSR